MWKAETLARKRDWNFHRLPRRRVRTRRAALAFVDAVGCCSTFYRFPEGLACLWEAVVGRPDPRWPRRSHHDDGVGGTWALKDALPGRREVHYGQLLEGRSLSRSAAIDRLLERYLGGSVFASEPALARLFGLPRAEVARSLARLARAGRVRVGCEVSGWPGRWVISV